jgi:hypothetical protein
MAREHQWSTGLAREKDGRPCVQITLGCIIMTLGSVEAKLLAEAISFTAEQVESLAAQELPPARK